MITCDGPGHIDLGSCPPCGGTWRGYFLFFSKMNDMISSLDTCHTKVQSLAAPVSLTGVGCVPVLSTEPSLVGSPSSHTTGIKHWGTARGSPGTVVVTVLLRPALGSSVDSSQFGITDCGFVASTTDISLVSVDAERSSLLSITGRTSNGTSIREPVAGLAVFASNKVLIVSIEILVLSWCWRVDLRESCYSGGQDTRTPGDHHPPEGQGGVQLRPRDPPDGRCCSLVAAPPQLRGQRPPGRTTNNNIALRPRDHLPTSRNMRRRIEIMLGANIVG